MYIYVDIVLSPPARGDETRGLCFDMKFRLSYHRAMCASQAAYRDISLVRAPDIDVKYI